LATVIRQRLRRRGISTGIRCIYSIEPSQNTLPPNPIDVDAHIGPGRKRTPLGTISYMPAIFGLRVAQEAIHHLLGREALASQN
jgi:tRNA A37 threonylcarbamoyladenosine dehydratase